MLRRGFLSGLLSTPLILRPPSMGRIVPVTRLVPLDPANLFGSIVDAMMVHAEMVGAYGSAAIKIEGSADGIRFVPVSFVDLYRL